MHMLFLLIWRFDKGKQHTAGIFEGAYVWRTKCKQTTLHKALVWALFWALLCAEWSTFYMVGQHFTVIGEHFTHSVNIVHTLVNILHTEVNILHTVISILQGG